MTHTEKINFDNLTKEQLVQLGRDLIAYKKEAKILKREEKQAKRKAKEISQTEKRQEKILRLNDRISITILKYKSFGFTKVHVETRIQELIDLEFGKKR